MTQTNIGDRIKAIREERGFSASDLARLTDVSPTAVANWENNGRTPRPATLAAICKALGVPESFILKGKPIATDSGSPIAPKRGVGKILEDAATEIAVLMGVPVKEISVDMSYNKGW